MCHLKTVLIDIHKHLSRLGLGHSSLERRFHAPLHCASVGYLSGYDNQETKSLVSQLVYGVSP